MADFDPVTMATSLATYYVQGQQDQITAQKTAATDTSAALTKLRSALSAFDTAIAGLSGTTKTVAQNSATFSSEVGTATAKSSAAPGTYSFVVEQLATAHQVAFKMPNVPPMVAEDRAFRVNVSGAEIEINLKDADINGDGEVSAGELARTINQHADNGGKVSAGVVTVNGESQLVLTAGKTGADNAISLDLSGLDPASKAAANLGAATELVAAQDAIVWMGAKDTGMKMQQASNTFDAIEGVSMTFTATSTSPVTLTVASDVSATKDNVQRFVDAYNAVQKVLGDLTRIGNAEAGTNSGVFASDSSVRALKSRLSTMVREEFGGVRLADLGVSVARDGTMSVDATKLETKLKADPTAFDTVFGKATLSDRSGLLGAMDSYLDNWLSTTDGQIQRRQETLQRKQSNLNARQDLLDLQYESAYKRHLAQYTQLQALSSQMGETTGMLGSMFTATS